MQLIKQMIKFFTAGLVSLVILSLFVFIYGFSGIHVPNPSGSTDYKWSSNQIKTNMSEGFSWLSMDYNGFNNTIIPSHIDILLVGSSHMEAVNVGKYENTAAKLCEYIPELSLYNIGVSGHTFYRCAKNLNNAVNEYKPQKYVIIETDTVLLEKEQIDEVINGTMKTIPSYNHGMVYYVQKYCPAIKSIYKKIQDWKNVDSTASQNTNKNMTEKNLDVVTMNSFFKKIENDCGDRKLIIFYHPKTMIDDDGKLIHENEGLIEFREACNENNILFVDMTEDFERLYEEKHILGHGFINTAIGTGHLNKYGHEVIAKRLSEVIMEDQQQ